MSSNLMPGVDRSTIVKVVAIWLVISGILGLCGGLALLGVGALGGIAVVSTAAIQATGADSGELSAAGTQLAAASGFALVLGIIFIILAPISLVVAWALFNRRQWARMGVVVIAGLSALGALLGILTGGGVGGNIVQLIVNGFVAYFFYTDPGIQQTLTN